MHLRIIFEVSTVSFLPLYLIVGKAEIMIPVCRYSGRCGIGPRVNHTAPNPTSVSSIFKPQRVYTSILDVIYISAASMEKERKDEEKGEQTISAIPAILYSMFTSKQKALIISIVSIAANFQPSP
jgi:hypothetical protein